MKKKQTDVCGVKLIFNLVLSLSSQALAGEVGMSSELDEVARALFNGHIPAIWKKLAPDTLKSLGNWMVHFKRRYKQYSDWVRGTQHHLLCNLLHDSGITQLVMS